jgi:hypothetical protein
LSAERVDVGAVPLRATERALYEWQDEDPKSLERAVSEMGNALGETVVGALADSDARHLYVSPVGLLHAFPFSQLALEHGRLGDRLSVSYAHPPVSCSYYATSRHPWRVEMCWD